MYLCIWSVNGSATPNKYMNDKKETPASDAGVS